MGTVLYRPSSCKNRHFFFVFRKKSVKMSWEENIASLKDQGLEHVAFYGIGSGWVVPSDGSNVTAAECKTIIDNIANQSNFQMSGIRAGGNKYMFLLATDSIVRGKKGLGGIHCAKSKNTLIVGVYGESTQPGSAAVAVENFAAHLEKNNLGYNKGLNVLRVKTSMSVMPTFL